MDLSTLSSKEKNEFLYWKAWRAATKLRQSEKTLEESSSTEEDSDTSEYDPMETSQMKEPDETSAEKCLDVRENYYAVFFLVRMKKSFYIGRVTEENGDTVKLKFLERKLVGSQFVYDWPRRDDVCCVERGVVLREVNVSGPPSCLLEEPQRMKIQEMVMNM